MAFLPSFGLAVVAALVLGSLGGYPTLMMLVAGTAAIAALTVRPIRSVQ